MAPWRFCPRYLEEFCTRKTATIRVCQFRQLIDLRLTARRNWIESDHAALKQRLRPMRSFRTSAGTKATLAGIEIFRTIRNGQLENSKVGVGNEIVFVANFFPDAA
ncbi:DDE-type integrase/transposase/recombinase [Halovulum sp. GXIMD14794]